MELVSNSQFPETEFLRSSLQSGMLLLPITQCRDAHLAGVHSSNMSGFLSLGCLPHTYVDHIPSSQKRKGSHISTSASLLISIFSFSSQFLSRNDFPDHHSLAITIGTMILFSHSKRDLICSMQILFFKLFLIIFDLN